MGTCSGCTTATHPPLQINEFSAAALAEFFAGDGESVVARAEEVHAAGS
jgi:hypothetical protein